MLHITCPRCSAKYRLADQLLGSSVACGKCGSVFEAGAGEPPEAALDPPAEPHPAAGPGRAAGPERRPAATGKRHAAGPRERPAPRFPPPRARRAHAGPPEADPAGAARAPDELPVEELPAEELSAEEPAAPEEERRPHGGLRAHGRFDAERGPVHAERGARRAGQGLRDGRPVPSHGDHWPHGPRPKPLFVRYPILTVLVGGAALLGLGGLLTLILGGGDGRKAPEASAPTVEATKEAPAPSIVSIQPDRMTDEDVANGEKVTIFGKGFQRGSGLDVLFDRNPSPSVVREGSGPEGERIEAQVPLGRGVVAVKVKNPDGQESNSIQFTYSGEVRLPFDPDKDLDGYRQVSVDRYAKWIIDLKPFDSRKGESVGLRELEKIRALWKQASEAFTAEIRAMDDDPRLKEAYRVAERLHDEHEYFKKVDFFVTKDMPFVYFIQRPPKDVPGYRDGIVSKFAPLLQELRKVFLTQYAEKLGLERKLEPELYCIAVLATRGNYAEDFAVAEGIGRGGLRLAAAHYDPRWRLAVTYEDEFTPLSRDQERRDAILHEFVHALQHAYCECGSFLPKPVWYTEGFAEFLAAGGPEDLTKLSTPTLPKDHLRTLGVILQGGGREVFLNSLVDLVTADGPGYGEVIQRATRRANGKAVPVGAEQFVGAVLGAFYAQSTVTIYFLHEGEGGKYRQGLLDYMKAVQADASGWEAFTKAFEGVDPKQLQSEFFAFVRKEFARQGASSAQLPDWTPTWSEPGGG